ncbi:MAG: phosphatase PAP2 family protein [Candidatus Microthrix sp.]|uniref:phosphatase PAP2 family protein n=1 Tax=Candidatus Neomicrothrix sp. TaxID=2719034 RepID=UPI0025B821FD|nr:phosphatase PAP2 family protein [Candidatus Microthrix sp.]MBL0204773.1 phosphatase PAP2 family protein [Candidatus Microthrix sp.]
MRVVTNMLDSVDRFGERTVAPWRLRPAVDLAATYASWAGEGAAIWFGWGALRLAIDQRIEPGSAWVTAGGLAATLGLESAAVNVGLKGLVRRPRPVAQARSGRDFRTTSFPSGHAASSFAAATFLGRGGEWAPLLGVAVTVTTSRVVLGVHHLSDVVAGAVGGGGFGLLGRSGDRSLDQAAPSGLTGPGARQSSVQAQRRTGSVTRRLWTIAHAASGHAGGGQGQLELMIDLAYAAVVLNDPGMADEVAHLEHMNDLVQSMREVCILACRRSTEAESMASVLQVISAIEGIANAAIDITRIVTHRLGIPPELIADLSNAEEVSHRVWVRDNSHMARRPLAALELPVATGMRVMAIRRDRSWITDIGGDEILLPGDVLFVHGSPAGLVRLYDWRRRPPGAARPGKRRVR